MGSRVDIVASSVGVAGAGGAAIQLPWNREPGERLRFGLSLALFLVILLPLAVVVPRIELPEPDRQVLEQVPPQLARLIETEPEPEPTPKTPVEPVRKPEPVPEPEPPKPRQAQVEPPAPEPAPVTPKPEPKAAAPQTTQQARAMAAQSGLLALSQELSAMQTVDTDAAPERLSANVTDKTGAANAAPAEASTVLASSQGIEDEAGPRETVVLASHEVKQVEAPKASVAPARKTAVAATKSGPGERSMANIRRGFDQQKAALFSMYNRALRKNPALAGEVLLEVTIEPDGHVSGCRIVSSELGAPALERKIVARVSLFNFGAADVTQRLVRFPINFLPS